MSTCFVRRAHDMDSAAAAVTVKKEPSNSSDEMKEFAETAMNELLGWYGYEPEAEPDEDDTDARRGTGDSSGPEFSDSGGGGGGSWCAWCSKPMAANAQATGAFCSELCFSQSRRASFKRNRTCDWCRTARNSVSHVDVRDGARRLQFCGDACLNQYKMHIFCRETRAHLQLHPHTTAIPTSGTGLITPELWLKDCRQTDSPQLAPAPSPPSPRRRPRRLARPQPAVTSSTATTRHESTTVPEGPQDLRTRPRSPADIPAEFEERRRPTWPPPPPPITVLVPYPVVVPVPLPLPLPIPIPVPEEVFRRATAASSVITTNVTITTTTTTTTTTITTAAPMTSVTASDVKQSRRTLRARKRPAPFPRTTVPA